MPNVQDTEADELKLDIAKDESVEDTQNTSEGEGESDTVPNLEEGGQKVDKLSPAEENAKQQEEAWLLKVTSGKSQVEDAPKWLQGRLNSRLDATSKIPDTEEVVRNALAKEREDSEFKALQGEIPKLTTAQAKELQERFKTLRPAGRVAALKASLDAMGLSKAVREAEERGVAKGKVSFPRSGQPALSKSEKLVGGIPLSVVQSDAAWNRHVRNSQ